MWASAVVLRWMTLSALALVIGALLLEVVVMPREAPVLAAPRRRLRRWIIGGVLLLMLTTVGQLIVRAQVMSGGSVVTAISVLPLVLRRTHFGTMWIIRGGFLVTAMVAVSLSARGIRCFALFVVLGIAATTAMTGHGGDWGDATASVGIDLIHIWAASAWTGGLMALVLTVIVDMTTWPLNVFRQIARRFSTLAGWCLVLVAATGIYNAVIQVSTPTALLHTAYGRVLLVKLLLFLALGTLGAVNRYGAVATLAPGQSTGLGLRLFRRAFPRLAQLQAQRASVTLSRYVAYEALLAVIVFGCTALLGESTPARHQLRMQHGSVPAHSVGLLGPTERLDLLDLLR